ncbi:Uncharacterised protein [Kingella potus]|uniref:Lipoprotein n=1 Tax=Kingella potus TaxID=265175 RepID=A0A377QYL3_9NEIS|nr:hypothetical protein [Kingella potus]UOP01601.1 hypothetical protein LVJ84_05375 [Kingella potus]STR00107.1 Uncharacterised protein [Kingella potus]
MKTTLRLLPALLLLAACSAQEADSPPPAEPAATPVPTASAPAPAAPPTPAASAPAIRGSGSIEKQNLPELMIEGAARNSLSVVYDPQGRPEKIEYGFGSNYRVHHYRFLYRDGKPSSAQADTLYYRPNGSPDTAKTRSQHILFDDDGAIAVNDTGNPPPERPIDPEKWQTEILMISGIAGKYSSAK